MSDEAVPHNAPYDTIGLFPKKVASAEDYESVGSGHRYIDPTGTTRTKPWTVTDKTSWEKVPDGASFVDPEGNVRQKRKFEGVTTTADTLYKMALTDKGRRQALANTYGEDRVREDEYGLWVEDEKGVARKPGRGVSSAIGHVLSDVAPVGGGIGGGVLGGVGGTAVEPVGGTAAGAFGGMTLGAAAGRQFNNVILSLAGIHEDMNAQLTSMSEEAATSAVGQAGGHLISKIPGAIESTKNAIKSVKDKAVETGRGVKENLADILESYGITPKRARDFLMGKEMPGHEGENLARAQQMADITNRGGKIPPSVAFPEAPGLKKVEEFDAVFRAQNVFGIAAQDFYEKEATKILENEMLGVEVKTPLTRATEKVSSQKAGELTLAAAQKDMAHADAALEDAMRGAREEATLRTTYGLGPEKASSLHTALMENLESTHKEMTEQAESLIKQGLQHLRSDVDNAIKMHEAGQNPGALWKMVAGKFNLFGQAIKSRAREGYSAADAAAGHVLPDVSELTDDAAAFLKSLPQAFRDKYPNEIRQLAKLAENAEGPTEDFEQITWSQLRHLRSWVRSGIDYNDLTPDVRQGSLMFLEKKINRALHNVKAPEELKEAARILDKTDEFYGRYMPILEDQRIETVTRALKAGSGGNPEALARTLFTPDHTESMAKIRAIVGENYWSQIQNAHTKHLLDQSKTLTNGVHDGQKFSAQVLELERNGLLKTAYDEVTAKRLAAMAEDIQSVQGTIPLSAGEGSTIQELMKTAQVAAESAKKMAAIDPLKMFSEEMKRLDQQYAKAMRGAQHQRRAEPLGFLYEEKMSGLATTAADKILAKEDTIRAAAQMFGRESPEFKALQEVYAHRFFQRQLGETGKMLEQISDPKKGITDEIQALMFPGVTRGQMVQLSKDMNFLFSAGGPDVGGSLAAASRVLNPWQHIPLPKLTGVSLILHAPGVSFAGRFILGKTFATIMDGVSHPNFMNWLAGNLKGEPIEREVAKRVLKERMRLGGWFGGALAQAGQEQRRQGQLNQAEAVNQ